jgi:DNA-binding CsgD family transcriptional regulator
MLGVAEGVALLERDRELGRIGECLDAASGGTGALVLIAGSAGIGKTSLLGHCRAQACDRGIKVLAARGDELVMESSFAVVRELLGSVREERPPEGAARLAEPVFDADVAIALDQERAASVLHGLHWLVASLAEHGPLVLLIDDAHWLDPASARFLVYLARRLDSLPVLVVLAARRGEGPDPGGLVSTLSEVAAEVLAPSALSAKATASIVRGELGPRADDELCRSCHEATAGNPFYLGELLSALRAEGGRPSLEAAERVRELGAGAVGRSVLVRVARLGADCELLAQAAAVLASGSPLRHGAALAGLDRARAQEAADSMRAADVLAVGQTLTFAHPIVREAVVADLAPSRRAALHLEAARLLADEGASADRVAAHLLSAEPFGEPWVVEALRRAAQRALAQGAPEAAASYLRRALAEPPAANARVEVLVELGRAEAQLPAPTDFAALREALVLASEPRRRAEIACELAWALVGLAQNADARVMLEEELARATGLDAELVERLEALLIGGGAPDLTAEGIHARLARNVERFKRGEIDDPVMLAALAQTGAVMGLPADEVATLSRHALAHQRLLHDLWPAYTGAIVALSWTDGLDEAASAADSGLAAAARRGVAPMFSHMSLLRSQTALRAGEIEIAEMHSQQAVAVAGDLGPAAQLWATMWHGSVLLERGRADEAAELLEALPVESALGLWQGLMLLADRGRVRVALGDLERGVADLLEAERRATAAGCHLGALNDWMPAAAIALHRLGRREEATEVAARELEDAAAFGAARRHGLALSVCGLLDPSPEGLASLEEAVQILERSPARLEHARALMNLGTGLRARGAREAAREPLAQALDIAHRCGGTALSEQVREQLVATGARPRRETLTGPESLTPAELRAARMASQGLSNREIAQALFVTAKTVEWQLSHAYAKLGIRGRRELAAALSA